MPVHPPNRVKLAAVLVAAVLGISSSAVLVRGMDAGPAAITVWRCAFATLLLAPALPAARTIALPDRLRITASGLFLGLHFATWFASLGHTTVLRSTVLVALVPLWTALLEWLLEGRPPPPRFVAGVVVAIVGIGVLGSGGGDAGWLGDALATFAGGLWAVYLLIGRSVRQRVPVTTYMGLVSLVAGATMLPVAALLGEALLGYSGSTWALLVAATLGPQLLGHQGFSYAVKYLPASTIAAIMLLEPVGASGLAALLLHEVPGPAAAAGGLLVLIGLGVALEPPP